MRSQQAQLSGNRLLDNGTIEGEGVAKGHAIFDGEINDLKSLDEALELGVVKERGKGLVAL